LSKGAGEAYRVPAFRVKAVDTVGAGDAFSGALALALTEGRELEDAVRFASAAAAVSVTRRGAQPSLPRRNEVLARLKRG
jgi:ribokinase